MGGTPLVLSWLCVFLEGKERTRCAYTNGMMECFENKYKHVLAIGLEKSWDEG